MALLLFRVPEHQAGARLDRVLAERPELDSRALAERLIASGAVLVDGEPRAKSFRLEGGEEISAEIPEATELAGRGARRPDRLGGRAPARRRQARRPRRASCGVDADRAPSSRACSRTAPRAERTTTGRESSTGSTATRPDCSSSPARPRHTTLLQELIRSRELERTYAALVRGTPKSASGRIEAPIGRDRRDRTRHSLDTPTPREAVTWFDVVETMRDHALLDVRLETGRTHQIRVHLEAIELPVSGDPVYGVAATSASSASSSTRAGSGSRIRSPAPRSTSAPSCRRISRRRSSSRRG